MAKEKDDGAEEKKPPGKPAKPDAKPKMRRCPKCWTPGSSIGGGPCATCAAKRAKPKAKPEANA